MNCLSLWDGPVFTTRFVLKKTFFARTIFIFRSTFLQSSNESIKTLSGIFLYQDFGGREFRTQTSYFVFRKPGEFPCLKWGRIMIFGSHWFFEIFVPGFWGSEFRILTSILGTSPSKVPNIFTTIFIIFSKIFDIFQNFRIFHMNVAQIALFFFSPKQRKKRCIFRPKTSPRRF